MWYWLRSQDSTGSGRVDFSINQAASELRVSIRTIRHWLYLGTKNGLFRAVMLGGRPGERRVYLAGVIPVALALGVSDLGVCFDLEADQIWRLRQATTEAVALHFQQTSIFSSKRRSRSGGGVPLSLESILADKRGGGIVARGERYTYVDSSVLPIGGSQKTTAEFLGRHESTVQRRLSNLERERRSLPILERTQLAQARFNLSAVGRLHVPDDIPAKFFKPLFSSSTVYEALTNVYDLGHVTLRKKRHLKRKLKRAIAGERTISTANRSKSGRSGDSTISKADQSRAWEDLKKVFVDWEKACAPTTPP